MIMQIASLAALLVSAGWPINSLYCPREIANHPSPYNSNITVSNTSALVCSDHELIYCDISNLPEFQEISHHEPYDFVPLDAAFYGKYAVISGVRDVAVDPPGPRPGRVCIFDYSIPAQPSEISRVDVGWSAVDIKIQNKRAYVAAGSLFIIDLTSVTSPVVIGQFRCGDAQNVYISGSLAYLACGNGGLCIVDISFPSFPQLIGHADVPSGAHSITVSRGKAYVASNGMGLQVFDVLIPSRPRRIGSNDEVPELCDIAIRGNSLFASGCDEYQGWLFVYDISNPANPIIKEWMVAPGSPGRLALSVSNLFIVGWDSISVYELMPCPVDLFP